MGMESGPGGPGLRGFGVCRRGRDEDRHREGTGVRQRVRVGAADGLRGVVVHGEAAVVKGGQGAAGDGVQQPLAGLVVAQPGSQRVRQGVRRPGEPADGDGAGVKVGADRDERRRVRVGVPQSPVGEADDGRQVVAGAGQPAPAPQFGGVAGVQTDVAGGSGGWRHDGAGGAAGLRHPHPGEPSGMAGRRPPCPGRGDLDGGLGQGKRGVAQGAGQGVGVLVCDIGEPTAQQADRPCPGQAPDRDGGGDLPPVVLVGGDEHMPGPFWKPGSDGRRIRDVGEDEQPPRPTLQDGARRATHVLRRVAVPIVPEVHRELGIPLPEQHPVPALQPPDEVIVGGMPVGVLDGDRGHPGAAGPFTAWTATGPPASSPPRIASSSSSRPANAASRPGTFPHPLTASPSQACCQRTCVSTAPWAWGSSGERATCPG